MKEYEKLAKESCTWIRHPLNAAGVESEEIHFNKEKYNGYIAGFLKAREMAEEITLRHLDSIAIHEEIINLGEGKV